MSANPNAQQQRPPNQQRPNMQPGAPGAAGVPNAPSPAMVEAGHKALKYFQGQNITIPQAIQLLQQKKLTPDQTKMLQIVLAAFGAQMQRGGNAANVGAAMAATGGPANGPSPPPAAAGSAAPTGAPVQGRPPPGSNQAANNAARVKLMIDQLQNMTDIQRAAAINAQPTLGGLWASYLQQRAQAGGKAPNVRPPPGQVRPPNGAANGLNSQAPPLNLQLPPGRARPPPNQQQQQQQQQNGNMAGRASPALQQQQQQRLQNSGPGSRVGSPAQQQQMMQQQQLQQQQQQQQNPAVNGPVPISRPGGGTSAAALAALPSNSPAPHPNAGGARPTLSTGLASGPVVGTPSLLARSGAGWDEAQRGRGVGGPGQETEDGRKRKLREMVESLEPGEKVEMGVEDLLLELVDEMIDSSTQMAARLAKHRKSNVLEVRDMQLHLERNHNIRVPGISSDEIRQNQSQTARRTPVVNLHAQRVAMVHAAKAAAAAKANAA